MNHRTPTASLRRHAIRISSTLAIVALAAGCGTFKVRDKNEPAVAKIRKAALVSFASEMPAPNGIGLNLSTGKIGAEKGGSMIDQSAKEVDQMLAELRAELAKNMKWKMTDQAAMLANEGYQASYHKTMDGWQSKMPPGDTRKKYVVDKVMDYDAIRILGLAGRAALIKSLGVDAIVAANLVVDLNGTTVMGVGSRHPQSKLAFDVFTADQEAPVWFDGQVSGDESAESVGKTGFFDESLMRKLALESARTAFVKVGRSE